MLYKKADRFFDLLEDRVRKWMSHHAFIYAITGSVGVVLFWRGIWHTMDYVMLMIQPTLPGMDSIDRGAGLWWDGPLSILLGAVVLLTTGLLVSSFIGNEILISGLRGEKKISDKTEQEVALDISVSTEMEREIEVILGKLESIQEGIKKAGEVKKG